MFVIKIGEDKIKLVDKEDVKILMSKLLDIGCSERVTAKKVEEGEQEGEEDD